MNRHDKASKKPGSGYAFNPKNTLSSSQEPDFSKSPKKVKKAVARALSDDPLPLQILHRPFRVPTTVMVNERTPSKALPRPPSSESDKPRREKSPDDDLDFDRLQSMHPGVKAAALRDPFRPSSSSSNSGHPKVGHHKMMSSRKQQANNSNSIFIPQKSRPEHHLDPVVRGPAQPTYKDRKAPSLPSFNSNVFNAPPTMRYGEDEFYTDPNKANAELKDLLEGVMDDDDDKDGNEEDGEKKEGDDDPKSGVVAGLNVKLLPHQVEGVEWMRGRELGPVKRGKVPKGGILADDMGLGKTLQTLSLILTNQKPKKEDKRWKKHYEEIEKTTLVVAPLALIRQWESEIVEKIAKSHQLKVCVHHGPQRTKRFKDLALYDVVITTYNILVSENNYSSDDLQAGCFGLHWWRVVLDEAHTIKNRNAKSTKACYELRSEYRWCLSGTPMQNNLDELQSLVKFLRIMPYDNLKHWKEQIDLPMKNGKGHLAIRRLHSLLRCFMKRRTKAILKEAGALNPGGKPTDGKPSETGFKVTERNVVTVTSELSTAERRFYNRLQARADRSMDAMMGGKVSYASALTLLLRMRQACNHPKLVAGKLDKDALSTDPAQKNQELDVDDMADMFAGLGIESKSVRSCRICGLHLSGNDDRLGRGTCEDCTSDLAHFDNVESSERKKTKKSKVKRVVEEKAVSEIRKSPRRSVNSPVVIDIDTEGDIEAEKTKRRPGNRNVVVDSDDEDEADVKNAIRRPRNRNAVADSDDEEEDAEGSWLVAEDQRGAVNLGKCGGSEDENAEGDGDSIGSEDSEDEDEGDTQQSNLSSFVVDDDVPQTQESYHNAENSSDDESLLSISAITKQLASQTLDDKPSQATASATASETEAVDSETEESDTDEGSQSDNEYDFDTRHSGKNQILASAKIRELIKILHKEVEEHKFIVFSQFTSMLDIVEPFLEKEHLQYTRYDGSMKNDEREQSLHRLRNDKKTRILLCSLKCGSLGLNLTAATRVVILEPFWNPVSPIFAQIC